MNFDLNKSIAVLENTPRTLKALLEDLPEEWILSNEGKNTWSVTEVVIHLIHGEKTNWISRMELILSKQPDKTFVPFIRVDDTPNNKSLSELLNEFEQLRSQNLDILKSKSLSEEDLQKTGFHPNFGEVSLSQLLSTWTVHDLTHMSQIARVMAKQYKTAVGPWREFLSVLK